MEEWRHYLGSVGCLWKEHFGAGNPYSLKPCPMGLSSSPLVHGERLPALINLNHNGESRQPGLR
eukprot:1215954-Rhodomonas_salina.1